MGKIYQKIKAKVKQAYHSIKPYVKSLLKQGRDYAVAEGSKMAKEGATKVFEHAKPKLFEAATQAMKFIPSMAAGGMIVRAPARIGKVVRLHKGELVIPARKVRGVMRALRKSKIEIPISRRV